MIIQTDESWAMTEHTDLQASRAEKMTGNTQRN